MGWLDKIASRIASELDEPALPLDDQAQLELAQAYLERGDLEEAGTRVHELLERHPRVVEVLQLAGLVAHARNSGDEAVALLGRAVDADPARASSWLKLSQVLLPLGRLEPAQEAARKALKLAADQIADPQRRQRVMAKAHAVRGRVALAQQRYETARRELDRAMALGLEDPHLAADHGRALVRVDPTAGARWLLHAARAPGASCTLVLEAAGAQTDPRVAADLLIAYQRTTNALGDGDRLRLEARIALALSRAGDRQGATAWFESAQARASGEAAADLAHAAAALERYADACRLATLAAQAQVPIDPGSRLAWALGSQQEACLRATADDLRAVAPPLVAHVEGALGSPPSPDALLQLLLVAPDEASRRHWAARIVPAPPEDTSALALLQALEAAAGALAPPPAFTAALSRAREGLTRPLLVALLGEFNAGKSSLVNALVETPLAPVGIKPTTATLNIFRHGMGGAHVLYASGKRRRLETAQVQPFLSTLAPEDAEAIEAVEIFLPHAPLQTFEWVDTPGLNAPQAAHERTTRQFMRLADVAVWVLSAHQAAKATEVAVLEELREGHTPVLALLNKTDQLEPSEVPIVHEMVARALGPRVFAIVDGSLKRSAAEAADALSHALWAFAKTRVAVLKQRAALMALQHLVRQAQSYAKAAFPEDSALGEEETLLQALRSGLAPQPAEAALATALSRAIDDAAAGVGEAVAAGDAVDEAFVIRACLREVQAALSHARSPLDALPAAAREHYDIAARCFVAQMRGRLEAGLAVQALQPGSAAEARRRTIERALPDMERFLWTPWREALAQLTAAREADVQLRTRTVAARRALHEARVVQPLAALAERIDAAWAAVVQELDAAAVGA